MEFGRLPHLCRASTRRARTSACAVVASLIVLAILACPAQAAGADYRSYAGAGVAVLQQWYNPSTGLFNSTNWWNAANALNGIVDYSARTGSTTYRADIGNTFDKNSAHGFLNYYYDDEGWWALTWINAYDLTGDARYLAQAKSIFTDIAGSWDSTCGGGVYWSKARRYKNAIANELFLTLAARLHERTPDGAGGGSYLEWALREWTWFERSGMINSTHLVNDGLVLSTCQNNHGTTWTYNQGVILGGLTDLYKITGDPSYRKQAQAIADAATNTLVDANGILKEPCEPSCGADGPQFKGIFTRNLFYLYEAAHTPAYREFITRNVDSIWANDRNSQNQLGLMWAGPFDQADAARQSSALDALNAAIPFSKDSSG
jgi:predicted alpha-1,6-mannanase (GH76 family)